MGEFDHVATVEEQADDMFDADCSCGWDDTGFEDREDAEVAVEEHLREVGAS